MESGDEGEALPISGTPVSTLEGLWRLAGTNVTTYLEGTAEDGYEVGAGTSDNAEGGALPFSRTPVSSLEGSLRLEGNNATCPDGSSEEGCKVEVSHRRGFGSRLYGGSRV